MVQGGVIACTSLSGRGICGQQTELGVKGLHFTNLSRTPQCLLKFPQVTVWCSRNCGFITPNKRLYIVSIYRVQFLWSLEVMERLHQQLKSNHAFLIAFINIVFVNSLILYCSYSETVTWSIWAAIGVEIETTDILQSRSSELAALERPFLLDGMSAIYSYNVSNFICNIN